MVVGPFAWTVGAPDWLAPGVSDPFFHSACRLWSRRSRPKNASWNFSWANQNTGIYCECVCKYVFLCYLKIRREHLLQLSLLLPVSLLHPLQCLVSRGCHLHSNIWIRSDQTMCLSSYGRGGLMKVWVWAQSYLQLDLAALKTLSCTV